MVELETAVEDFRRTQPYKIGHRRDDACGETLLSLSRWCRNCPLSLPLLLGDVIHNLRSTLDHLAGALVSAAGGTPDRTTSFPIFESLHAYQDRSRKRLDGVNHYCFQMIDNMQPYKGGWGHWAWQLHQLDTHRQASPPVDGGHDGRWTHHDGERAGGICCKADDHRPSRAHAAKQYARASSSPNIVPVHVGYDLGNFQ